MKKVLRLIAKIIATPIVVPCVLAFMLIGVGAMGWNWLFDNYDDLKMDKITLKDAANYLGKWFTTL